MNVQNTTTSAQGMFSVVAPAASDSDQGDVNEAGMLQVSVGLNDNLCYNCKFVIILASGKISNTKRE